MGSIVGIILAVLVGAGVLIVLNIRNLIYICAPNEVLIFSGSRRRVGNKLYGYKIIKGGRKLRVPLMERVDRLDLTNMVIDISVSNAYSKGGVPLAVQGVANVKVAGHEPVLNNAIERFLGKSRHEIMQIAKMTLEGSLRGILATMTPEEVNEDKILFAERLVADVEEDMTRLGLVIDTFKLQNVQDEVSYLDSIGRKKNAEILRQARIAEAVARADAAVRAAENREREMRAKITAETDIAKADAQKRLRDALTRRDALVAEEQATVAAALAQSKAEIDVQKARVEQMRRKLDADIVQPAKALCESMEADAKARAAPIVADGEARAMVLRTLAERWKAAGPNARDVFLLQKMDKIIDAITATVADTHIQQVTMIDSKTPSLGSDGSLPVRAISTIEQIKQVLGVDILDLLKNRRQDGTQSGQSLGASSRELPTAEPPES